MPETEHDHQVDHIEAGIAQHLDRAERVAAGGDDILDDGDPVTCFEAAFDLLARAVALLLFAHEQEREPGLHRHRSAEEHGAQLGRGKPLCFGGHELSKLRAQTLEQGRLGLEEKFVEVAIRATA